MHTYHGSCHCGAVTFEFDADLTWISQCNCSICSKKGSLTHRVPPERFRLTKGEDALVLYQYNTRTASHFFCKHCGIHGFHHPRFDPAMYSINLRCLEDFDLEASGPERRFFDGKNWEQAARKPGHT